MSSPLKVGDVSVLKRVFSQEDFDRFAALSGDDNPIHVDPEFSARTRFGRTICHGMLLYATISTLLGAQFPGAVQLEQELSFVSPVYAGEEVMVRVEAKEVQAEGLVWLETVILKPDGVVFCQGKTLIRLPDGADAE